MLDWPYDEVDGSSGGGPPGNNRIVADRSAALMNVYCTSRQALKALKRLPLAYTQSSTITSLAGPSRGLSLRPIVKPFDRLAGLGRFSSTTAAPAKMRCVLIKNGSGTADDFYIGEEPIPVPKEGEVQVKVGLYLLIAIWLTCRSR